MKRIFLLVFCLLIFSNVIFPKGLGIGSDAAFPAIEKQLAQISITKNKIYTLSDEDIENLIITASEQQINIFELFDCMYRYLLKKKFRVKISGNSLQKLMSKFDFGRDRVLGILPIILIDEIQIGNKINMNDKPLQFFLISKYEHYIEIGTAFYEKEFGFNKLEPHFFKDAYGMRVKKMGFKMRINKIHLYDNGKGAIYVHGFFKPKRWNLWLIEKIIEIKEE